ncbi:D-aminoacyl-tRNA deacylase [Apibacter sp. HY039]|uniref:D-aminoacyl-tRNA deacylase n=1 Tax=Apibacter sp. HY039 TaxID=2501476 RepID=UPI000FEB6E10|nr:D-aminoacyl-tRNA deacylase [Apibacter sp. HY039]
MRVIIQRVSEASVKVDNEIKGCIEQGLLILLGIEDSDTQEDIIWLTQKISNLRIFNDEYGVMNLSVQDVKGQLLLISQFTLFASTKKGNRPSYIRASGPDFANSMYEQFKAKLEEILNQSVECGVFGADMKVHLLNDGPVTIFIDSHQRE